MPQTTDRRVRRTRAALRTALEQLMREKSIQDITVKELCAVCDINRGTFYAHYRDVTHLLWCVETELQQEFDAVLDALAQPGSFGRRGPSPSLTALFAFLQDNAGMCRVLLCEGGDMSFVEQMKDIVRRRFLQQWNSLFSDDMQQASGYAYAFVVSGCIGVIQQWLAGGTVTSPQQMAAIVEDMLARGLEAFR